MYKIIIFGTGLYGKQALQFFTRENVITKKIYMEN